MIILNNNITLTTNKTVITDKTLGYWGKKTTKATARTANNNNTYSLHPSYEKTTLSSMQHEHLLH